MARTGRFGRLPGPGFDYSSIVGSLLAQYENARNANILSAWRSGGKFEGKKVTDGRLLAWFKARRDEYSRDDPEWDKWNQQITQFRYDIAEQKMMLSYASQNIGEGAVARWYANSAKQFPRNSQAWRDAMINAARYRKAAQEKAAAARRAAAADQPSRTELYSAAIREVNRTHINPAIQAETWFGKVLKGAGVTGGGSWSTANIDALSGGHEEVKDWIFSEDPRAVALRRDYEQRFGHEFNFRHFQRIIKRGAAGTDLQINAARKYEYYTDIPGLRENKQKYNAYNRRINLVKNDKWSDYLQVQEDAEEALREADTPEEKERIRRTLAKELQPIQRFFENHQELDAAFIVGETIDAATGGEVSATASLEDAPWGQSGSEPRLTTDTDQGTGIVSGRQPNTFNASLIIGSQQDREHIEGLRDGTYVRMRNPEDGNIVVVPAEEYPDIAATHFLDNILDVTPGIKIDGKKYEPRSNAVYTEWTPGRISVSNPDDPYIATTVVPDGVNEFSVAQTMDGELVYRYNKPNGQTYTGPIAPFDERIQVFGYQDGVIKVSGAQVRAVDPTFMLPGSSIEPASEVAKRAEATLGVGAGSRSAVFKANQPPEEQAEPVTERPDVPDAARSRLHTNLVEARAELAAAEKEAEGSLLQLSIGQPSPVERARDKVQKYEGLLAGYEGASDEQRTAITTQLEEAEAEVRKHYDSGADRFGGYETDGTPNAGARALPSEEFSAALATRDALVAEAQAAGIEVEVDKQEFFITGPGLTISTAVRTSIPEQAVNPPPALVDKPPVYSPVLTEADNPLAAVIASESQWSKLSRISPEKARTVFDTIVAHNGWENDGAAKARLAHSMEAAFMAGDAGDTHLDWMRNYSGSSLQEAQEMAQRIAFFRQRREELDDSGVDFWDGIDQHDLSVERRRIKAATGLSEADIDREYPWLASARPEEPVQGPEAAVPKPAVFDIAWQPQTADMDTGPGTAKGKSSRPVTASDLLSQHPDAVEADALAPPRPSPAPGDFDFQPPDVEQPEPSDYQASRPGWNVPQPTPLAVPTPAASAVPAPTPMPVASAPVSTAQSGQSSVPKTSSTGSEKKSVHIPVPV